MVWKENGKFGIHTGRTLRKTSTSPGKADCGFLIKTVRNQNIHFTDEQVRGCLKKFQIGDGLDEDNVVKESRDDHQWRFGGGRGYLDDRVLYSLGKRKRWLVSMVLRDKIPEDFDAENDYKVILVERLSVQGSSWYCSSPRLRRGDCRAVLEGEEARKPKRRKFAHVGDLRGKSNDSSKTEIVYEVNQTEPSSCWPSYLQHDRDWREFRAENKARCKTKGVKNKTRLWGEFSKYDLNKTAHQTLQERILDFSPETDLGKDELVSSSDNQENFSLLNKCDFDVGKYISEVLAATAAKSDRKIGKKNGKTSVLKETELTAVNPASSQLVKSHGKGSAVHVDRVNIWGGIHDDPEIGTTIAHPSVPVATESVPQNRSFSVDVDIISGKLDMHALQVQFGEMYIEGESIPRRFSIGLSDLSTKFVFTCQPYSIKTTEERAERVSISVVSDALPSQQSQHCKEFLENFFGILEHESKVMEKPLPADKCSLGCSPNTSNSQLNRVAVMPFDLLYDINKCSHKASTVSLALPDILRTVALCPAPSVVAADGGAKTTIIPETVVCEVCCCEFYHDTCDVTRTLAFPCTALKSCLHWFCNECWKAYLSAQLQQGKVFIKCPAYDCNTIVDDVTLMGLQPNKFHKLIAMRQEKAVEMSSKWKWCPENKCNLVVRAASLKGSKDIGDKTASLPVHCPCGHDWCFSCQEEPHWPASCYEAKFFRSQTETYEKIFKTKTGGITSVSIKRCPHCSYPIEKNQGCPHMVCGMCRGEFCWTCLGPWNDDHWSADCNQKFKEEEEVELVTDIGSTRFNANLRVAIVHRMAKAGPMLYKKYSAVKKLEDALHAQEAFHNHCLHVKRSTPSSVSLLLSLYNSHHLPKYVKLSADFKFLAHFVVENVSILMAVSKTKRGHNTLKRLVSTLLFVADRLEHMASNRKLYLQRDKVHFEMLLKAGKHCIHCVRRICINIHQH